MNQRVKTNIIMDRNDSLEPPIWVGLPAKGQFESPTIEIESVTGMQRNLQELSFSSSLITHELLLRLMANPSDADALIGLCESHATTFRDAVIEWFGREDNLCRGAAFDLVVAVARSAWTYDPMSVEAVEFVRQRSHIAARRLRELWNVRRLDGSLWGINRR